jgi:TonB family protein
MGRGNDALRNYYRALVFTGKGSMPKEMNSDADVLAYVARTRGAIGYVSSAATTENVKVLRLIDEHDQGERRLLTRVEPAYPHTLQERQIGGTVRLSITISPKGTVESAAVLGGNPILAEEAVMAVMQWIYAPGPARTTMEVTISFGTNP